MAKKIVWSESAIRDRVNIFQFWTWHNKSVTYSNRLELLLQTAADLIGQFPHIGIQTDKPDVRAKLVKNFRVLYRETEGTIEIIRVWDTRQSPDKLEIG